jgi:hypothetical protein
MTELNNDVTADNEEQYSKEYYKAKHACDKLGLNYNFNSIKFVMDTYDIAFVQLQTASFWNYDEQRIICDYIKATMILVQAGLVGSGYKYNTVDELETKAYEIITNWLKKYPIELLFILLNEIVEDRNFFMTSSQLQPMSQVKNTKTVIAVVEHMLERKIRLKELTGLLWSKDSMKKYLL